MRTNVCFVLLPPPGATVGAPWEGVKDLVARTDARTRCIGGFHFVFNVGPWAIDYVLVDGNGTIDEQRWSVLHGAAGWTAVLGTLLAGTGVAPVPTLAPPGGGFATAIGVSVVSI